MAASGEHAGDVKPAAEAPHEHHDVGDDHEKASDGGKLKPAEVEVLTWANKHNGLTSAKAAELMAKYGPNELADGGRNKILLFLSFFWGPMPIMIWAAIIIELIQACLTGQTWPDFAVLMALQFANGIVGFIEESNAGDAIAALKANLRPKAMAKRDGAFKEINGADLVPGDLIAMHGGSIVPADCVFVEGEPAQVDQSALTGESLPVTKKEGQKLLMSSTIKQGHVEAVVVSTGADTFMGTSAKLIAESKHQSRLHSILLQITIILLVMCIVFCAAIFAKLMTAKDIEGAIHDGAGDSKFMRSLSVVVVILVASIPVAIEVVVTSTMAVGSHQLVRKEVIVARLSAIEELAGMDMLVSDKTGTLTKNILTLRSPIIFKEGLSEEDVFFYSALASKRSGQMDAIDKVIADKLLTLPDKYKDDAEKNFVCDKFVPFNANTKRCVVIIRRPDGTRFKVAKGAPQVALKLAHNYSEIRERCNTTVTELASRGFRALGVAVSHAPIAENLKDEPDDAGHWEYVATLSLVDPPRDDTLATIEGAYANGIEVKMATGDQAAIARETCRELGMGTSIFTTEALTDFVKKDKAQQALVDSVILSANGFAEVMPEHKHLIVKRLQNAGHVCGMTGDGVNDAPALKAADIGIAVQGATDAAKAAAAIVLTKPGLSVIIDAIYTSRQIFQRMRNYIIYRIACTIQLLFFFFFAILCIDADTTYGYAGQYPSRDPTIAATQLPDLAHAPHFTLPVISLVIITILNDGCMITISGDLVMTPKKPQMWNMVEVWIVAVVLGAVACLSSLILVAEGMHANTFHRDTIVGTIWGAQGRTYLTWYELKTIIYLKISVSDFLTLFSARSRTWFWERCVSWPLGLAFLIATATSTLFSLFWWDFITLEDAHMDSLRHSKGSVVATWVYCILWFFIQDAAKVGTYWVLDRLRPVEEIEKENFALDRGRKQLELKNAQKALAASGAAVEKPQPEALVAKPEVKAQLERAVSRIVDHAEAKRADTAGGPGSSQNSVGAAGAGVVGTIGRMAAGTIGRMAAGTIGRLAGASVPAGQGTATIHTLAKELPTGVDLNQVLQHASHTLTKRTQGELGVPIETANPAHRGIKDVFARPGGGAASVERTGLAAGGSSESAHVDAVAIELTPTTTATAAAPAKSS